eukprot:TRINITY_DN20330_c0_g1_i1.p1 TRINITY_DN20330_c0_g1~~TRINITY_DN20330_c0_g1_i1.p1  ORF type:complete len:549 (-),score=66.94 TRINITY_DN20330_c0_g1_i1:87-1733(-)
MRRNVTSFGPTKRVGTSQADHTGGAASRVTPTLEEILVHRLHANERNYEQLDARNNVTSPKRLKFAEVNEKESTEKAFTRKTSNFEKHVDLPSLGVMLQVNSMNNDFNFQTLPNKAKKEERQRIIKERLEENEKRSVLNPQQQLEGFEKLPDHVLEGEPFLKFLYDKKSEEVATTLHWQQTQPKEIQADSLLSPTIVGPSTPLSATTPEVSSRPSSGKRAGTPSKRNRANKSSVDGNPSETENSNAHASITAAASEGHHSRPSTTPSNTTTSRPVLHLMTGAKQKRGLIDKLVAYQSQRDKNVEILKERQKQVDDLQQQVQQLQESQAQGTADENAVNQGLELEAQIADLQEQQSKIIELHNEIVSQHGISLWNTRDKRRKKVSGVQVRAQQELLQCMQQHTKQEVLARKRLQQRHQRSNALLWNKQYRYEQISRPPQPTSPPSRPTTAPTPMLGMAPSSKYTSRPTSSTVSTLSQASYQFNKSAAVAKSTAAAPNYQPPTLTPPPPRGQRNISSAGSAPSSGLALNPNLLAAAAITISTTPPTPQHQ